MQAEYHTVLYLHLSRMQLAGFNLKADIVRLFTGLCTIHTAYNCTLLIRGPIGSEAASLSLGLMNSSGRKALARTEGVVKLRRIGDQRPEHYRLGRRNVAVK
ncbi:uncharacterized protein LAJ45_00083 [Morchella importuna]|uniref:uncharacterized protein n=1 Tax=Morchella importuna TaxID=1174673 RepID=UPI001E8E2809|nr:uncharacterized protein LAJ45_00083 [Morchella importuna]KAH8155074.1 hypothetical protein LAJ45_00083 [Morchella importuna]